MSNEITISDNECKIGGLVETEKRKAEKLIRECKRIVILSGAGVSTGAGIKDFRSPGGIYDIIKEELKTSDPEAVFHVDYPDKAVTLYYMNRLFVLNQDIKPTSSHHLANWLCQQGRLSAVITQNGDRLYQKAGLSSEALIEYHRADDGTGVMFGQPIGHIVNQRVKRAMRNVDLLLIMGTSLQVAPFSGLINYPPFDVQRIVVDLNMEKLSTNQINGAEKVGGRMVRMQPQWSRMTQLWKITEDCDTFSARVMAKN